jgi:hypothetical protein
VRCYVYLDDIIVYSESFGQHLSDLEAVFDCIRLAGLRLSAKKCHFGQAEVKFLGHYIDATGTRPDPRLITAVQDYARPRNVKHIERFLGLAGFYRRFIRDFSKVAAPLNELCKKGAAWQWTAAEEGAF